MNIKNTLNTGYKLLIDNYNYSDNSGIIETNTNKTVLQISDYTNAFLPNSERIITHIRGLDAMFGEYEDIQQHDGIGREFISGFNKKDIILIAGMSGMGKTTFAFNLFSSLHRQGHSPVFISLDMRIKRAWDSFRKSLIGYRGTSADFMDEMLLCGKIPKLITLQAKIFVDDIDNFLKDNPAPVIFIDYIDNIKPRNCIGVDKRDFESLFMELKQLADKHNCAIIILSQSMEDRGYKQGRPTLASIYGGKEVRSAIDHALAIYRNGQYNDNLPAEFQNIMEVKGLKLRSDSSKNICYVKFIDGKIEELTQEEENSYRFTLSGSIK